MVCFGLEPGGAGWKVQTNPLFLSLSLSLSLSPKMSGIRWDDWLTNFLHSLNFEEFYPSYASSF